MNAMKNALLAGTALSLMAAASALAADKVPNVVEIAVGTLSNPFFAPLVAGAKAVVTDVGLKASDTVIGAFDVSATGADVTVMTNNKSAIVA